MPAPPAGPPPRFLTGHLADFRADRLGFFLRCAREYGDVVPLRLPGRRVLLFSRPDLIEQVLVAQAANFVKHFGLRMYRPILGDGLVTSEGGFWRRQRKLAAPAFHPGRLAAYAPDMTAAAGRMVDGWASAAAAAGGGPVVRDVHDDLMRLTLDIACKTLFGADACPDPHAVGAAMESALRAIDARFARLLPVPDWLPTPANLRLRRAVRALDSVVGGIIARRRAAATGAAPAHDLLSVLLRARDEDGSAMTDQQLLDEARTIFLAGHETTALALTYALYLLADHPDAQGTLRRELDGVLGGRPPTHADLPRLPYARQVVGEAMRLYPPADVLGREAVADCTVCGVPVPRGTTVFMSQWAVHRDPRYFPEPEAFDPGRWTDAFERALPRFAYFPFGGGPRVCVGQAFAIAEASLVLAAVCQRVRLDPDPAFRLELRPSITLRPRHGVRVLVRAAEADQRKAGRERLTAP
ncbi:MAG: Unspecific monooxygenase [Phycisphaerales bacterium]|nr:Unspecific monooxygenase [Phycisphaerales bacterium]